jgi:hypothetical protein
MGVSCEIESIFIHVPIYGRGLNVFEAGEGNFANPQASNTGRSSLTRPGIEPSCPRL